MLHAQSRRRTARSRGGGSAWGGMRWRRDRVATDQHVLPSSRDSSGETAMTRI
ncbi:hypothetical protein N136_02070 [Leifsonia aquatica ATCC 14665]|uniref:Uncharacterized protein n=1 Tax=Leifsonia aquatica ATCC 14665 TaxID=1358026 RepID=U2T276_LEIAQ|nr:hypothetical protein N136_02070 [Leifsonia aquatica ATCC 14665]